MDRAAERLLRVVAYLPGEAPRVRDVPASPQGLRDVVGGEVDAVALPGGFVALVNAAARVQGLPLNRLCPARRGAYFPLHGPVVVAKIDHASGAELVSLSDDEVARALAVFPARPAATRPRRRRT